VTNVLDFLASLIGNVFEPSRKVVYGEVFESEIPEGPKEGVLFDMLTSMFVTSIVSLCL
jgi:hypothetical protein